MYLGGWGGRILHGVTWLKVRTAGADVCEHGSGLSGAIKGGTFRDYCAYCELFRLCTLELRK